MQQIIASDLLSKLKNIKNENRNISLIDIVAIDHQIPYDKRFQVIYLFRDFLANNTVEKISVYTAGILDSVCEIFPVANWQEREIFDLFGIEFLNHPNLYRILNEDNFVGYPLRKDFIFD